MLKFLCPECGELDEPSLPDDGRPDRVLTALPPHLRVTSERDGSRLRPHTALENGTKALIPNDLIVKI
jgi:hypothetical protein